MGLKLTEEQQEDVLALRERVLVWLNKAAEARQEAYALFPPQLTPSTADSVEVSGPQSKA